MADIECVFESVSGRGSLYISNLSAAQNLPLLKSLGIRAVLSVARSGLVSLPREEVPHYLYIPAEDREDFPLSRHFDQTFEFIEQARKETNVLVHCVVGVSRSVTVVIAYLLRKYRYSLGQVINMLQRRRQKINPNSGFLQQLRAYAQQLGLNNDFKGAHLTPKKDSSPNKQKRPSSAPKHKPLTKLLEHPLPDLPTLKLPQQLNPKPQIPAILFQKSHELQRDKSEIVLNQEEPMTQSDELPKETNEELKKSHSTKFRETRKVKRLSIEEKIGRVREKILKKELDNRLKLTHSKENNSRLNKNLFRNEMMIAEKNFKAKMEEHFNAHCKDYLITLSRTEEEDDRPRVNSHHMRYTPPFHIFRDEPAERDFFNAQIQIQPITFSTAPRLQSRSKPNH